MVEYDDNGPTVRRVLMGADGARDVTDLLGESTIAEIEAQLRELSDDSGLDLIEASEVAAEHETGEPDMDASGLPDGCDQVTRAMFEDSEREASE